MISAAQENKQHVTLREWQLAATTEESHLTITEILRSAQNDMLALLFDASIPRSS
jgi:hypothetical protein